jgi:hypothetical protein
MVETDEKLLPNRKKYSIVRMDAGYPPDHYEAEQKVNEVDDLDEVKDLYSSEPGDEITYYAHDEDGEIYSLD